LKPNILLLIYEWQRFVEYLRMIRFSHSVFALPFAYAGVVLAGNRAEITVSKIVWITIAMVSARSAAMGFNRLADHSLDARNPRTKARALPEGRIGISAVQIFVSISLIVFFLSAAMLNRLALFLSPLAVFIILSYSYTKRFTVMSHYILGLSLGIAPIGGWIGITGVFNYLPVLMSAGVLFWVAGFDIIYSLSDIEIDRREGLKSIPVLYGIKGALWISRISHFIAFMFFSAVYLINCVSLLSVVFLVIILVMLLFQHISLKPEDEKSVNRAFFIGNSVISIVFFAGIFISDIFFK
jgi:4-hydroxybenzoate polyprenyltransferase